MFKIGDKVQFNGCPFDEQIPEEMMMYTVLASQTMTVTRAAVPGDLFAPWTEDPIPGQQWVKTDMTPDWIDSAWFKRVK